MKRIILDCNFLCYRAMHGIKGELTYNEKKVNVIFGFLRQIFSLADLFKTPNLVFCWDSRKSYRKIIYPPYKGQRRKELTPEERLDLSLALEQFDELREKVLPGMGFRNVFMRTGYEADDLISVIPKKYPSTQNIIVSSDTDLLQLIDDMTQIYNFKLLMDRKWFSINYPDLHPSDWVEVKSIAGCSSDNIEGVSGVGEIKAYQYLTGKLSGKVATESIKKGKELIDFNRKLIELPYSGPKPFQLELDVDLISPSKFYAVFNQYGFRSLASIKEAEKWKLAFFTNRE